MKKLLSTVLIFTGLALAGCSDGPKYARDKSAVDAAKIGDLVRVDSGKYVCTSRREALGMLLVYKTSLSEAYRRGESAGLAVVKQAMADQKAALSEYRSCFYARGSELEYTVIGKDIVGNAKDELHTVAYQISDRHEGTGWIVTEYDRHSPFKTARADDGHPVE